MGLSESRNLGIIDGVNRLISLVVDVFRQVGRGRIWLFLAVYFVLSWFVLYAHYNFTSPLFFGLISAWTGLLDSQRAAGFTHYQGHFILLPFFFDWAKLILSILVEGVIYGSVAILFYERFVQVDEEDRFRFKGVARLWIHLALALIVVNGIILLVNVGLSKVLRPVLEYSPRRQMAFAWLGMPALYAIIIGVFFYMVPSIAIYGDTIVQAVKRSVRMFRRNPGTSVAMACLVLAAPLLISNIVNSPETIVNRFKPELVYYLLVGGLVVDIVVGFLWMGMAVRLMVDQED